MTTERCWCDANGGETRNHEDGSTQAVRCADRMARMFDRVLAQDEMGEGAPAVRMTRQAARRRRHRSPDLFR